jgi:hypothetical protein
MVEQLWRYLVKSAQGESLESVHLGADGPQGDRRWACLDADGLVVSAKQPRKWGRLLQVDAWTEGDDVLVRAPGADAAVAGTPEADAQLSSWLGSPVTLSDTVPEGARLRRLYPREAGMRPSWSVDHAEDSTLPMGGRRRFVDFAPVHIVTLADLAALGDPDVRRFRPNLVLSVDPLRPGDLVRLEGGVELRVTLPTPRCAIPGAEHPGLSASSELLRLIGSRRTELPGRGSAACVGVYADVVRPGIARVGERAEAA